MPVNFGEATFVMNFQDNITKQLDVVTKSIQEQQAHIKKVTEDTKIFSDTMTVISAGATAFGLILQKITPGFAGVGKALTLFGGTSTFIHGIGSATERMSKFAGNAVTVAKEIKNAGGVFGYFGKNVMSVVSSLRLIWTAISGFMPLVLALSAVMFVLYTIWTENLFGIQDTVFGVFATISDIIGGVINFIKGVVVGFIETTMPLWKALGAVLHTLFAPLIWLANLFRGNGEKAFTTGKIIGKVLAPALLLIGTIMAVNVIPRMVMMAITTVSSLIPSLITMATAVWTTVPALWAMAAALLANPITWIVLAIAALIAGLIYLFTHLSKVAHFLKTVFKAALLFALWPVIMIIEAVKALYSVFKWIFSGGGTTPAQVMGGNIGYGIGAKVGQQAFGAKNTQGSATSGFNSTMASTSSSTSTTTATNTTKNYPINVNIANANNISDFRNAGKEINSQLSRAP